MHRLAILLTLALIAIAGPSATRIQLTRGRPAITLAGDVQKGKEQVYVFRAQAGSKFDGRLTTRVGKTGFSVEDPEGKALPEEEFDFNTSLTGRLTRSVDYQISVSTFETNPVHFGLTVRVY